MSLSARQTDVAPKLKQMRVKLQGGCSTERFVSYGCNS